MKKGRWGKSTILAAVACVAIGVHIFSSPTFAQTPRAGFIFMGGWFGDPDSDGAPDVLIMNGSGSFNSASVQGEGSFTHFEIVGGPGLPPIRGFGTWKAGRVISWEPIGVWGAYAAGILIMEVTLHPTDGDPIAGTLKVVCNIPPGGLDTGELEAITLTLPGGVKFGPANVGVSTTTFPLAVQQRR